MRPTFEPWVGKSYGKPEVGGFRLLVVGHSHYGDAADANPSLTTQVVERHIKGTPSMGFFTLWGRLLANRGPYAALGNPQVLNAVAFYNFLQSYAGDEHDSKPTKIQWEESVAPFLTVLDDQLPHAALVLGVSTWDEIRFDDGTRSVVEANDSIQRTWIRPDNHRIAATLIDHPRSHGFSPPLWASRVEALLVRGMDERNASIG